MSASVEWWIAHGFEQFNCHFEALFLNYSSGVFRLSTRTIEAPSLSHHEFRRGVKGGRVRSQAVSFVGSDYE